MTGEKLGTIGDAVDQESMPEWKKSFLSTPSISVRKGIARGFNPPSEDTDTLVLTANSYKFVDVRFPRKYDQHMGLRKNPTFWAFSGVCKTTFPGANDADWEWPYMAHSVWKHEIDSKGPDIHDEGDLMVLKNGDSIELGVMKDETSGELKVYKEYWSDPPLRYRETAVKKTPCVVAEIVKSDATMKRGRIVRVGDYCQGVAEVSYEDRTSVLAARYVKAPKSGSVDASTIDDVHKGWVMDERSRLTSVSDGREPFFAELLPCAWACDSKRRIGDETTVPPTTWRILEMDKGDKKYPPW